MNFVKIENINQQIETWMTYSKNGNLAYHLFISHPKRPAPPSGYPVIYVLDGNAFFQTVEETVRLQSRRAEKTGVHHAIIIGIGYPTNEEFDSSRRFYDLTPPTDSLTLPPRPQGGEWPKNGGADLFLDFIENEVKPFVNEQYVVDSNQQIIYGHSLGGLFVLHTLFSRPKAFQSYIASSPSIWWNQQSVLQNEASFLSNLDILEKNIHLFLSVGSLEKDYMVKDARQLYKRLLPSSEQGLQVDFREAHGENHLSVVPTTLSRALRFVFIDK